MMIKLKPLLINLAIPLGVGALAALLTRNSFEFYETIVKPPLAPPGALFPIVWTILYLLMGVSSYLIWMEKRAPGRNAALQTYLAQLALNFVWPLLFFRARAFLPAFLWLLALIVLIVAMIAQFKRIKPIAGYLQIPYLLWCLFAAYLNLSIWLLNR